MNRLASLLASAALLFFAAGTGQAAPLLKADVTVGGEAVTIGDLFTDAGALSSKPIFRSPDLGRSGTIDAQSVVRAARAAGLDEADAGGVQSVTVRRPSRKVTPEEMGDLVRNALATALQATPDRLDLRFDTLPAAQDASPLSDRAVAVSGVDVDPIEGRFTALITVDAGGQARRLRITGSAVVVVEVVTANRPIDRGEIVSDADLTIDRMPARKVGNGVTASLKDLVGLAARRPLRAGMPLSASDFTPPFLVTRGGTVTIVFRRGGLVLTARGKAMENGARGSSISVMNTSSNRMITATVVDRGTVEVSAGAPAAATVAMRTDK